MPPEPPVEPCAACGGLPDDVTVQTGLGAYFPDAFYDLESLGGYVRPPFRRCPACATFFHWIDLPQFYGSGNLDEERAVRLSPEASRLLDRLFPPDPRHTGDLGEPAAYVEALPLDLLAQALGSHVFLGPEIVAPFVPTLVRLLAETNEASLAEVLGNYLSGAPGRAGAIVEAAGSLPDEASPRLRALLRRARPLAAGGP